MQRKAAFLMLEAWMVGKWGQNRNKYLKTLNLLVFGSSFRDLVYNYSTAYELTK